MLVIMSDIYVFTQPMFAIIITTTMMMAFFVCMLPVSTLKKEVDFFLVPKMYLSVFFL